MKKIVSFILSGIMCAGILSSTTSCGCKHEHTTVNRVEPTCTVYGHISTKCNDCGKEISYESLISLGHNPVEPDVNDGTCRDGGYVDIVCSRCGEILGNKYIDSTHEYEDTSKAPTCTEDGYEETTCKKCGKIGHHYTINKTGHNFKDFYCKNCGEAYCDIKYSFDLPKGFIHYSYNSINPYTKINIYKIEFSKEYSFSSPHIKIFGTKTYDIEGNNAWNDCYIRYSIKDENNLVVSSGVLMFENLKVNESKMDKIYFSEAEQGKSYTLELSNYY